MERLNSYPRAPEAEPRFHNTTQTNMTPDEVKRHVLRFIAQDPRAAYHFIIGTDSHVHRGYTKFVTGIVVHRLGKSAWACYRQIVVPREVRSIREKLALETSFSQQVAGIFDEDMVRRMEELLLPYVYQGAMLDMYIDIDAGTEPIVNKTSLYVQEMVKRVEAMGHYLARVKPEAYVASAYANRYTKRAVRRVM